MPVHDYNGTGPWSADGIVARYRAYAKQFGVPAGANLEPRTHIEGDSRWVYPVMEKVIAGIELGDPACVDLGIDFISESGSFPFGKVLKSNTARALRRAHLDERQRERIRQRVVRMLVEGYLPREFKQYAKLLRRVGLGTLREDLSRADMQNPFVARHVNYLLAAIQDERADP